MKYSKNEWLKRIRITKEWLDNHDNLAPNDMGYRINDVSFWSAYRKAEEFGMVEKKRVNYRKYKRYIDLSKS